jgi:photosystem II stability/assembly factor-like uncharacterized protein
VDVNNICSSWWSLALAAVLTLPTVVVAQDEGESEDESETILRPRPADIQPLAPESLLLDITRAGANFIAVGDRGHVLVSRDGETWAQAEVPVRAALTSVAFAEDGRSGWAVGHDATILHTADGALTWTLQNFEPELERPFLDLKVFSDQHAIAVGAYGMMRVTRDGGATWNEVDAPEILDDEFHLNSLVELDDGTLLIVGEMGLMAVSDDGGAQWTRLASPYEGSYFGAVPTGDSGALVYGLRGTLYVIDDVSATTEADDWIEIKSDNIATMFGGLRVGDRQSVLVGLNGVITVVDGTDLHFGRTDQGTVLSSLVALEDGLLAVGQSGVEHITDVTALQHANDQE